jgi:hypothetical protein
VLFPRRDQPERGDRLGLSLQHQRLDRLRNDRGVCERKRLGTDQHLAWRRGLLQAGRDVDCIAGGEPLGRACDDLAGRDADPPADAEIGECVAHLDGGAARAKGVVLVQHGHPENGHHRIADELLNRATVCLDDPLHPLEVAREQRAKRLGIHRLAERSRARHIAEKHRHRLALLASRRCSREWRPAMGTEAEVALAFPAAARADLHSLKTRPPASDPEAAA